MSDERPMLLFVCEHGCSKSAITGRSFQQNQRVGYEDPSYFSRDYKKQFGAPPQRNLVRLRSDLEM